MKPTPQTLQQIERAIRKIADKFPASATALLTDIHLQVKPESGELLAYNDDDQELTRVVVEQWMNQSDELYEKAAEQIRTCLQELREDVVDHISIMRPYFFVLIDEDHETIRDLYLVDDDTMILSGNLMEGFEKELDQFFEQLMKE